MPKHDHLAKHTVSEEADEVLMDKRAPRGNPRFARGTTNGDAGPGNVDNLDLAEEEDQRTYGKGGGFPLSGKQLDAQGTVEYTDAHVADRLTKALRGSFYFTKAAGWLKWSGKRWKIVDEEAVIEVVRKRFKEWYSDALAEALMSGKEAAQEISLLKRLLSSGGIGAVVKLCRGTLLMDFALFDRSPDVVNTLSGVVDLRTGEVTEHSASHLVTKIIPIQYAPGATHPDWDAVVGAVRPDAQEYLQVRMGQALTGHVPDDDVILFLHGTGLNGKSTFVGAMLKVMGEYGRILSDKILLPDTHGSGSTTELFDLKGLRCGFVEELPEGHRLNVTRMKKTTAARLTARRHYKDDVQFDPTHAMIVTSNYRPSVNETDHGTWRRLLQITFPYRYVANGGCVGAAGGELDRVGDPALRERVKSDVAVQMAALAWLVEGGRKWYAGGRRMPAVPASVVEDTTEWRSESDAVLRFWTECLTDEVEEYTHVSSSELVSVFNQWLEEEGRKSWGSRLFKERFEDHDAVRGAGVEYRRVKVSSMKKYRGRLSRPPVSLASNEVGDQYYAWVGVGFRGKGSDS